MMFVKGKGTPLISLFMSLNRGEEAIILTVSDAPSKPTPSTSNYLTHSSLQLIPLTIADICQAT